MSYISFYRKWRPQNFNEIIGQDYVVKTLKNAVSKNRLSHAYLFCGPRGTGKTSTARILAKAINCAEGPTADPCNRCDNCISISNGSSVDVIEIDAASNRGINEIRELRERVKYLPNVLRKKVYIIDEVHMLTTEAFNALLKVLEEPPEHVLFIMATTEPRKVIPTIMSRCQRFDFYPIPIEKIKKRLVKISESENISISESALSIISKYSDGSQRDADGMLEQLASFGDDNISVEDATSLLGVMDLEMLFEFTNILIEKNLTQGLLFADRILNSNQSLRVFVLEFLDHLYDLYVFKNYDNPLEILDISLDYKDKYLEQSRQLSTDELELFMDLFTDLYKQIRWSEGSKTFFKSTLIKAISCNVLKEGEIKRRIKELENEIKLIKNETGKVATYKSGKEIQFEKNEEFKVVENKKGSNFNNIGSNDGVSSKDLSNLTEEKLAPDKKNKKDEKIKYSSSNEKYDGKTGVIYNNWDNINSKLKLKKISVYAMFAEAKWFKVEDSILYFYLEGNKKWHKDQLNKTGNVNLISKVIEEVTGKNYKIKFELEGAGVKSTDKEIFDINKREAHDAVVKDKASTDVKIKKNIKEAGTESIDLQKKSNKKGHEKNNESKSTNEKDEDIFDYLEKKFEIKEK